MILVLGGTSETAPLARALLNAGRRVLVSTATDLPFTLPDDSNLERRCGALDLEEMSELIGSEGITDVIDATHPFAVSATETARAACERAHVNYVRLTRPDVSGWGKEPFVSMVSSHEEAARCAFSFQKPVLLTTGTRNLKPYVQASRRTGFRLVVRILNSSASLESCRAAGVEGQNIITGRGPFSVEENRRIIRRFNIGTVVAKESGKAGGTPAKIDAARVEGCRAVIIARPEKDQACACISPAEVVEKLSV